MTDRLLRRLPALVAFLAPAAALAQTRINAPPSPARTAGWYGLGVVDTLALLGLMYVVVKVIGRDWASFRGKTMFVAGLTAVLGIAGVVMGETEPVVLNPFLSQDSIETIETLAYGQIALGLAAAALAFYAEQVKTAFSGPAQAAPPTDFEPPPPVEPARPSLRKRAQS